MLSKCFTLPTDKAVRAFKYDITPEGGGGLERVGKSVRTVETEWEKCVRWGEGGGIKKKGGYHI